MFTKKLYEVGIAKEAVRGTGVAPTAWIDRQDVTQEDTADVITSEAGVGIIMEAGESDVVCQYSEGEISGKILDQTIGLLLLAGLGQVTTTVQETTAKKHVFSLLNSNQHPSLTIEVKNAVEQKAFPLAVLKSLKLNFEVGKYVDYVASFVAKKGAVSANAPAYTPENHFISKMVSIKIADTLAGLGAGTEVKGKKGSISFDKNVDVVKLLGSVAPADFINKSLAVEGTLELPYENTTIKDLFINGTKKAMRITIANTDVIVGAVTNPTITIDLAKVSIQDWNISGGGDDVVMQTFKYKALYSITDAKGAEVTLLNGKASY